MEFDEVGHDSALESTTDVEHPGFTGTSAVEMLWDGKIQITQNLTPSMTQIHADSGKRTLETQRERRFANGI